MNKIKIAIIGSGGHAKSCIDAIESINNIEIIGIIDNQKGRKKLGKYQIIPEKNISKVKKITNKLVNGVGGLKNNSIRIKIFKKFKKLGFKFPVLISKNSIISSQSKIGEGTIVLNQVYINSGTKIGKNCIINNKTLIEHDTIIGDHSHISTGVIINGNCNIGSETFIGSGSVLLNGIKIKRKAFIKIGTVVKKNII